VQSLGIYRYPLERAAAQLKLVMNLDRVGSYLSASLICSSKYSFITKYSECSVDSEGSKQQHEAFMAAMANLQIG
jgi:hypothetical protein